MDRFGNAPLYLLDADLPENKNPWLTHHLYCGDPTGRVSQRDDPGDRGIRALRALKLDVDIYHFNEGHAVLAGVELIREKMAQGASDEAFAETRKEIVFTTHTPVPAEQWKSTRTVFFLPPGAYNGLNYEQMKRLGGGPVQHDRGRPPPGPPYQRRFAVAPGNSQKMWQNVDDTSEIIGITNGVHRRTWQDPEIYRAYLEEENLRPIHQRNKEKLLAEIRRQTGRDLDPNVLFGRLCPPGGHL